MQASPDPRAPSPQNSPRRGGKLKCEWCRQRKVKKCESDRNQERCIECQKQGLGCGAKVLCPPKPKIAPAPTYAAVLSSPAPRQTVTPTSGPRPPIARQQPRIINSISSSSNNTNVISPKNFIALKFRALGNLREVFEKLDHDRRAIGPESFQPTQSHLENCECCYCDAFSCALDRIIQSFSTNLSELNENLDRIDLFYAEKDLHKVSRTIEAFFETTRSYISQDDHKLGDINTVYHNVSRRLLTISIKEGQHAEVGRLRRLLAKHDPVVASQLADSLSDTSKRITSTLNTLELPSWTQKVFNVGAAHEIYPPLHIALNYRLPLFPPQLQRIRPQNLQAKDPQDRNAVHIAAASSHTEFLRKVSLDPKLLLDQDVFGNTPLMVAAYHGDYNSFQILWQTGVGRELRDRHSRSIMVIACFAGSRAIVEFLLFSGVSLHDTGVIDRSRGALYTVAARNHVELCKVLLEHSCSQSQFTPQEMNEAVQIARKFHHIEILELLHGSSTRTGIIVQRLADGAQSGQWPEIERRQTPPVAGYPYILPPRCPPPPTASCTGVPTTVYPSMDDEFLNTLTHGEWGA